jgi:hypothetical protein
MKTITLKNGTSVYLFENSEEVFLESHRIIVGDPIKLIINDLNVNNSTLHENVTAPDDWKAHKYLFNGVVWTVK